MGEIRVLSPAFSWRNRRIRALPAAQHQVLSLRSARHAMSRLMNRRHEPPCPAFPSFRSAAPRRWSIPSASSRGCARRVMNWRASTPAPTSPSSIPAGFSTAPRRSRLPRSAPPWPKTARSSSPAAWAPSRKRSPPSHPGVLAVTGPQQYESVLDAVHRAAPPQHDPYTDLIPPEGIKLTPRHYAYLKISEGCNNRCTFCIIPKLRGDLVSRPAADVLREAEKLVAAGVKELLVISQDTSAYGVDLKYAASVWKDREVRAKFLDLARELGEFGVWVRLHYVYPYPHVDDVISADGRRQGAALSRRAVSAREPRGAQTHAPAGGAGGDARAHRAVARDLPEPDHPLDLHRRLSRRDRRGLFATARLARRSATRSRRLLPLRAGRRRDVERSRRAGAATRSKRSAGIA